MWLGFLTNTNNFSILMGWKILSDVKQEPQVQALH